MMQNTPPEKNPNLDESALSMAMRGKSCDEFADIVAEKVISRLMAVNPDMKEVNQRATDGKHLRGIRALCRYYGKSATTLNMVKSAVKLIAYICFMYLK